MTTSPVLPVDTATKNPVHAYDIFMSAVALGALTLLIWRFVEYRDVEVRHLLGMFDYLFCAIFFIDYLHNLYRAKNRWHYVFTWGLLDLASSIPFLSSLRFLRAGQLIRLLMAVRSIRILVLIILKDRTASTVSATTIIGLLLIVGACVGVLHFERDAPGANITNAKDVAWWAVVTTSTVGYGDFYPITVGGRLFAVLIMCVGIGLFATFGGALVSKIMQSRKTHLPVTPTERYELLIKQNTVILKRLEALEKKIDGENDSSGGHDEEA